MGAEPEKLVEMVSPVIVMVHEVTLIWAATPCTVNVQGCPDAAVATIPLTEKLIVQAVPAEN